MNIVGNMDHAVDHDRITNDSIPEEAAINRTQPGDIAVAANQHPANMVHDIVFAITQDTKPGIADMGHRANAGVFANDGIADHGIGPDGNTIRKNASPADQRTTGDHCIVANLNPRLNHRGGTDGNTVTNPG